MTLRETILGNRMIAALAFLILLTLPVVPAELVYLGYRSQEFASVLMTGISAVGTLSLAVVTYLSLRQNDKRIEEMRKQREKPLVMDEIENVIGTAIEALRTDMRMIEDEDRHISWVLEDGPTPPAVAGMPGATIQKGISEAANQRLRREAPQLWERMEAHDQLAEELCELGSEIAQSVEPVLSDFAKGKDFDIDQNDRRVLLDSIVVQLDDFGEDRNLYEFWRENGDELRRLPHIECQSLFDEFQNKTEEYERHSRELQESLEDRKKQLRGEYGIGSSELSEQSQFLRLNRERI
jgi:hypothetical protein